jgi:hypothetical protein
MVFAASDAVTKYETIYVPVADIVAKSASDIATLVWLLLLYCYHLQTKVPD